MKISQMRWLDQWFGSILCACASGVEKMRRLLAGNSDSPIGERLLLIKLSEMGVNVMLGDPMRKLQRTYRRENIWCMAFAESKQIMEIMNLVPCENMLFITTENLFKFTKSLLRAIGVIRKNKIDVVLNLEFFSRAASLITWLTGARRRVGLHNYYGEGPYCGTLMTHGIKFNPHLHISQMLDAMAEAVTLETGILQRIEYTPLHIATIPDRFQPTENEERSVVKLLRDHGHKDRETIVLINANTSDRELIPLRRWSELCYADLAKGLLNNYPNMRIFLTGSSKECATIDKLEKIIASPRCLSIAGKTNMRELITLYWHAKVMITNDSGPAHFASLTDMAVVVLFGPESPSLWRPLGRNVHVVSRALACSPCFSIYNGRRSGCRKNVCMDMAPGQVLAIVKTVLDAS